MPRHQEGVQDPGTGAAAIVSSMGVDHGVGGSERQWQWSGSTQTMA